MGPNPLRIAIKFFSNYYVKPPAAEWRINSCKVTFIIKLQVDMFFNLQTFLQVVLQIFCGACQRCPIYLQSQMKQCSMQILLFQDQLWISINSVIISIRYSFIYLFIICNDCSFTIEFSILWVQFSITPKHHFVMKHHKGIDPIFQIPQAHTLFYWLTFMHT